MKRAWPFLMVLTILLLTGCGGAVNTEHKTTTAAQTTTTVTTTEVAATTVPTATDSSTDYRSQWVSITTSKPYTDGAQALLNKNIPWTEPPTVPFSVEVYAKRGHLFEEFFSTENYEFHRSYMANTRFVFADGREFERDELQGLVNEGIVTPEQLTALFSLQIYPKKAVDTVTGEEKEGKMFSFQAYCEATVQQGNRHVHIYPPYDTVGMFYDDPTDDMWTGECHFNADYLRQLAEAACPGRSFAALTEAEGIRVGDTLFIPEATVEKHGIGVEVVLTDGRAQALHLDLPER